MNFGSPQVKPDTRIVGQRRTRRASGPNPKCQGTPRFGASRAVVFATGTCEMHRKTIIRSHRRRGQATLPDSRKTDSSKNIFRVGDVHLKEPASVELVVLTNGSSAGRDFLLNG